MKLGFCTLAFRNDAIEGVLRKAAEIGFDEVEIFWGQLEGKTDAELDTVAETARACGIAISGIAPYFWLTNSKELLQTSMQTAARCSEVARRIGAKMIRTFTDAGPTGIGSAIATEAHWQIAVDSLQTITAKAPDILFAVETHEKTLADTPATCQRLRQLVGAKNLVFTFQPFGPGSPIADFEQLRADVRQVHLNPHVGPNAHADLDQCGIEYGALIQHLARTGYEHSFAVELCVPKEATWDRVRNAYQWCRAQEATVQ